MNTDPTLKSLENERFNGVTMTEAINQFKDAASQVYDAVAQIGTASSASAKARLQEGKLKAMEFEGKAEEAVKARPLATIGIAFAAGWLVSRLLQRH